MTPAVTDKTADNSAEVTGITAPERKPRSLLAPDKSGVGAPGDTGATGKTAAGPQPNVARPADAASSGGGGSGPPPAPPTSSTDQIAGLSALKGLILYAAVFAFAALYVYFMVRIVQAKSGVQPAFDSALVTAAAALAGVLGSAFALDVGAPTDERDTNPTLRTALAEAEPTKGRKIIRGIRRALSLEPPDTESMSWPKTFGIWTYALVASAVTITYVCNQHETPSTIRALAVAFGGYVIALITRAYGVKAKGS